MVGVSCNRWNRIKWLPWFYILPKKSKRWIMSLSKKEGEVYMKRLAEEREKRNQDSDKDSVLL